MKFSSHQDHPNSDGLHREAQVVLAWDPNRNDGSRPYSCLARVTFPQMQRLTTLAVDLVASVIYDRVARCDG